MQDIIDRLKQIMHYYALNQRSFALKADVKPATISDFYNHKYQPSHSTLTKIIRAYPDISSDWLLYGKGEMLQADPSSFIKMPVVGRIAAGNPIAISDVEPLRFITFDARELGPPANLICFQVEGDSMFPLITNQDVVIVTTQYDPNHLNSKIAAVQINGENTLKQIVLNPFSRQFILMPINCKYSHPLIFDPDSPDDIKILGVLVLQIRKHYNPYIAIK